MIADEERRLLHALARDSYAGHGAIVDAGAFLGASTAALAGGLLDNPGVAAKREPAIHSYDRFIADSDYLVSFLRNLGFAVTRGESFQPLFLSNIARYRNIVAVHAGDILAERWQLGPVEILFLDICKSPAINAHMIAEFFPHLIPGRSIVVQQDYHHPYLPWIHVTLEALAGSFEVVEERVGESIILRLAAPFDPERLRAAIDFRFTPDEQTELLARAVARLRPENRRFAALAGVALAAQLHGARAGEDALDAAERRYGAEGTGRWAFYAGRLREQLAEERERLQL